MTFTNLSKPPIMKNIIIAILLVVIGLLVYRIYNPETDAIEQQETETYAIEPSESEDYGIDKENETIHSIESSIAPSSHLKFKGIPIDGSIDDFASKLGKNGFELIKTIDGDIYFEGDFAGYNCKVTIESTSSGTVCAVKAFMEGPDDWQPIEDNYKTLKTALTKKYGKPAKCVERFTSYMQPKSNSEKYYNLSFGECNYVSTFKTDKGTITLSISKEDFDEGVSLVYQDKENSRIAASDMLDEL